MAAASSGNLLAIAGNAQHEIFLFRVSDVIQGRDQKQTLSGRALQTPSASFVRKDGELGLLLRTKSPADRGGFSPPPQSGDLVFNIRERRVAPAMGEPGWNVVMGNRGHWEVRISSDRQSLTVLRAGVPQPRLVLEPRRDLTAAAIANCVGTTVLAVASIESGGSSPKIRLYDAGSGQPFRDLLGHTTPIESLSFSDDGRLLVSAGDDQFVCVWSLTDIASTLRQRGQFCAKLQDVEGGVAVSAWEPWELPAGLQAQDRLLGLIGGKEELTLNSARQWYETFSFYKPGQLVTIRRSDAAGRISNVSIPVDQMIDGRQPLFSLFVAKGRDDRDLDWIGWNPLGYFDSSGGEVEKYLGWHFNTNQEEKPTDFAGANQYQENRQKGLISRLIEQGRYTPLSSTGDAPQMYVTIPGLNPSDNVLRFPPAKIRLSIQQFPVDQIQQIQLTLDDRVIGQFRPDIDQSWFVDLSEYRWNRGDFLLAAKLYPRSGDSLEPFTVIRHITFRPAAPVVQFKSQVPQFGTTDNREFKLQADVRCGLEGQTFNYKVTHQYGSQEVILDEKTAVESAVSIDQSIQLEAGKNVFQIRADNATERRNSDESTVKQQIVIYQGVPAPVITSVDLKSSDGVTTVAASSAILPRDQCQVMAHVKTLKSLVTASLKQAGNSIDLSVGTWDDGQQIIQTAQPIMLQPGNNHIELAGTTEDQSFSDSIDVFFKPELPEIEIITPHNDVRQREPKTSFEAKLSGSTYDFFQLNLTHKHRDETNMDWTTVAVIPVSYQELQQRAGTSWINKVIDLKPGFNLLEFAVSHDADKRTASAAVTLLRPPKIVAVQARPMADNSLFFQVDAQVLSDWEIVDVWINGHQVPDRDLTLTFDKQTRQCKVQARHNTLLPDSRNIQIEVANREARSEVAHSNEIAPIADKPLPPVIHLNESADGTPVTAERYVLTYSVSSPSKLQSLVVLHNDKSRSLVFDFPEPPKLGQFCFDGSVTVDLESNNNHLEVIATNQSGGKQSLAVNVAYIPLPASIEIDGLSLRSDNVDPPELPEFQPTVTRRQISFGQPCTNGNLWLHGRLIWNPAVAEAVAGKGIPLQVWVNGFQQVSKSIEGLENTSNEAEFCLPLVLNQPQNRIQLKAVGLPLSLDRQSEFNVECANPETEQWLHLVIIGIDKPQNGIDQLEQQAMTALRAHRESNADIEFTTSAFKHGTLYRLPAFGTLREMNYILETIRSKIVEHYQRVPNHVLLIYYQGGEIVHNSNNTYLTLKAPGETPVASLEYNAVNMEELEQLFSSMWWVHVLFLDALQDDAQRSLVADDSQTALFPQVPERSIPLISALQDALEPDSVNLDELKKQLKSKFSDVARGVTYEPFVPRSIANLIIKK